MQTDEAVMNVEQARMIGQLEGRVGSLEDAVRAQSGDIKTLLALANRGKGGVAMLLSVGAALGSLVTMALSFIPHK